MIGAGRNKLSRLLLRQLQTMSMQSVKMKQLVSLILLIFTVSSASGNSEIEIKLKTVKDSVVLFDSLQSRRTYTTFTDCYQFENLADSTYLNVFVNWRIDGSFMMNVLKCAPAYTFVDSLPDGIYKIVIDNKPIEKATFFSGVRNGPSLTYGRRPNGLTNFGTPALSRPSFYFMQTYQDGVATESYALDNKFNVIEYLPIFIDSLERETNVLYYFTTRGKLIAVGFDHQLYFYFKRNGEYIKTLSYSIEVEMSELKKNSIPNGWITINLGSKQLELNFRNGVILNWQVDFNTKEPIEGIQFQIPSDQIGIKRKDFMQFK